MKHARTTKGRPGFYGNGITWNVGRRYWRLVMLMTFMYDVTKSDDQGRVDGFVLASPAEFSERAIREGRRFLRVEHNRNVIRLVKSYANRWVDRRTTYRRWLSGILDMLEARCRAGARGPGRHASVRSGSRDDGA
jgi:hypothetical protein